MILLNTLKLNDNNPRIIRDRRFDALVKSVKEFPNMLELRPIVVDDNGVILGGNMRYRALVALGYKKIPSSWVKKASMLTEEEKRRFLVTDNVLFGDFNMDALANEFEIIELTDAGMELNLPDFTPNIAPGIRSSGV